MYSIIPISLLHVISKIFGKNIHKQLLMFLVENNLLAKCQYGFRRRNSTEHAALLLYNDILRQLDLKTTPFSLVIDLGKALHTRLYFIKERETNHRMV